jgi:hypothetical protein
VNAPIAAGRREEDAAGSPRDVPLFLVAETTDLVVDA